MHEVAGLEAIVADFVAILVASVIVLFMPAADSFGECRCRVRDQLAVHHEQGLWCNRGRHAVTVHDTRIGVVKQLKRIEQVIANHR